MHIYIYMYGLCVPLRHYTDRLRTREFLETSIFLISRIFFIASTNWFSYEASTLARSNPPLALYILPFPPHNNFVASETSES